MVGVWVGVRVGVKVAVPVGVRVGVGGAKSSANCMVPAAEFPFTMK
jgi:hypothetical protein